MTEIIISGSAYGTGSDKRKGVNHLSQEAKDAIFNKSALVICERPINDKHGNWYVVYKSGVGRPGKGSMWAHRLPTRDEMHLIADKIGYGMSDYYNK